MLGIRLRTWCTLGVRLSVFMIKIGTCRSLSRTTIVSMFLSSFVGTGTRGYGLGMGARVGTGEGIGSLF